VADEEESASCGCKDGWALVVVPDCWVTLGLGGCELPIVVVFERDDFVFCFSRAHAFLYVILGGVEY
jgi:hypothetical protein